MSEPISFGRPFVLRRDRDISGVSGTGIVIDGVLWPDGQAAIHWRGKWALTTPHPDGMDSILDIHDHGGQGDLHVLWADEVAAARREGLATIVEAYDLPVALFGTEAETAYLHRRVARAIQAVQDGEAAPVEVGDERIVDAVMPIVSQLLEQRDRAQAAAGRAYRLADRWEAAHGSANFLVRAAGVELRDVLDENQADDHDLAAVECSAQYYKANAGPTRQCIRAAQHRADHIDEHGFHWSDTVATYPVIAGAVKHARGSTETLSERITHLLGTIGRVRGLANRWDLYGPPPGNRPLTELRGVLDDVDDRQGCPYCTGAPQFVASELGAHVEEKHARVLAVLAAGRSLDEQLGDPETRCRLPHEMEV
jgi:hypothetical protein